MSGYSKDPHANDDAKLLYSIIGQIDDRFVSEAIEYTAKRKKPARILSLLPMAATLVAALLVVTVAIGVFTGPIMQNGNGSPSNGGAETNADGNGEVFWATAEGYDANTALLSCLAQSRTAASASETAPAITDGKFKIVWRDETDGVYYTVTVDFLSSKKRAELYALIDRAAAAKVEPNSDSPPFSLWIVTGDGYALSPYLPKSAGTVSCGVLGDYAPEQLPSEAFAAFLAELIETNLE